MFAGCQALENRLHRTLNTREGGFMSWAPFTFLGGKIFILAKVDATIVDQDCPFEMKKSKYKFEAADMG